jgi:predicted metal-dependent hydrolase
MAKVFAWHFAEEIEHGCVVYDIFKAVSGSYFLRLYGIVSAYLQFIPALYMGAFILAFQDRSMFRWAFWRGLLAFTLWNGFALASLGALFRYMRPSFHPAQSLKMELVQKGINYYNKASAESVDTASAGGAQSAWA